MYTLHCTRTNTRHQLHNDRVLSAHRTSQGVVTYLRCPCGDVVVHQPPTPGVVRGAADRTVQHHLGRLSMLADRTELSGAAVGLVHQILSTLADAAEGHLEDFRFHTPERHDAPVAMLRALGRLAQRITGRPVPVSARTAARLDRLIEQLGLVLADDPAAAPCA